jgi:PAS domain S-box-containing protein
MTRHPKFYQNLKTLKGSLLVTLLVMFVVNLAVVDMFDPLFTRGHILWAALADALLVAVITAPLFWYSVLKPLLVETSNAGIPGAGGPGSLQLVKLLVSILLVEFLVVALLPGVFRRVPDDLRKLLVSLVSAVCALPFFWWLIFQPLQGKFQKVKADLLGAPLRLYSLLLISVFFVDFIEMYIVPYFIAYRSHFVHNLSDALGTTLLVSPILWWLVVRPLRSAAETAHDTFEAVRNQVVDAVVIIDASGGIVSFNPAAEEIFGYAAQEIIGNPVDCLFCEDLLCREELLNLTADDGTRVVAREAHEATCRHRDGSPLVMEISISRIVAEQDLGYLAIMRNISARKKMESELRESREMFRSLSEAAPIGVYHASPEGHYLYANGQWQEIAGLSQDEALRDGWSRAIHGDDRDDVLETWNRAVAEGLPYSQEFRFQTPAGEIHWVQAQAAAIHAPDGSITGYVGAIQDITERKKSEQTMRESLSLLATTLESTADAIVAFDNDRRIRTFNRKFSEMWGITGAVAARREPDILREYCLQLVENPEQFLAREEELGRHPEDAGSGVVTFRDGRVLEFSSHPHMLDGRIVGRVWSFRDVTTRSDAERALKQSETRFREIFEQTEDAIIFFKPGGCSIIDVNQTAATMYGRTKDELKAGGLACLVRKEDLARLSSVIGNVRREKVSHVNNVVNICRDGGEINVSLHAKMITLQGVDIVYCTIRNITERIRMEAEVRDIQAKLIHANKMTSLGLMVSGVAHEINNPNAYILANAELLVRTWQDATKILLAYYHEQGDFQVGGIPFSEMKDKSLQLFDDIIDGSRRINGIVNTLKDFARQDPSAVEREVDVNAIVTTAVTILHNQIIRYTDRFLLDLAENIPVVKGSNQQLVQVVINLLMNACQALPSRDRGVRVATGFDPRACQVTITVRDEGVGIPGNVRERVLEPFFTTKLDSGGTGLGLSISHSIVREHGGTLEFESEADKGTVFVVRIPALTKGAKEFDT